MGRGVMLRALAPVAQLPAAEKWPAPPPSTSPPRVPVQDDNFTEAQIRTMDPQVIEIRDAHRSRVQELNAARLQAHKETLAMYADTFGRITGPHEHKLKYPEFTDPAIRAFVMNEEELLKNYKECIALPLCVRLHSH